MKKEKLIPTFPDTLGAQIFKCSESSEDVKTKVAFVNRLIEFSPFLIATKSQDELDEAVRFLGQALDSENDNKLNHLYTVLMFDIVETLYHRFGKFSGRIGDVIQNISTQNNNLTLDWLNIFEAIGDKTCLRKIRELTKSDDPEIQKRALDVFCKISGVQSLDKESLKAARDQKKERSQVAKLEQIAAKKARELENAPINTINEETKTIDIIAKGVYPANVLSNYHRVEPPFTVDGVVCYSMEGFLQALKQSDVELQTKLCSLSGASARHVGNHSKGCNEWKKTQTLWWQGKEIKRESEEYMALVMRAYKCKFDASQEFRDALKASLDYTLTHSVGHDDPTQTVLTEKEFINCLESLRNLLR
ncbi:MAG: hypothetical protein IJF84_11590 [Thermoguttaceae bacterium]|nr:hypothetical protein [Thermoguttaceae bacterium]